jgi:hypothetical protein
MCGSCVQHLLPEAIVLFFVALLIAVEGVCDNHFIAVISVQKSRVSSVCSEPSDSSLSLLNKLSEVKDPSLGHLTGLGGFLMESVSIPSESWLWRMNESVVPFQFSTWAI